MLVLSGVDTCTGATTVSAGLFQVGNNATLGSGTTSLTVNGGTLVVNPGRRGVCQFLERLQWQRGS